ncbi:YdcF family protein [Staphylococcus edaphicus]|uniref:DUF218 domain-containing protein n=1 Tax=Staphylococcus edaphicus TaxID=1955013 RepID=A0A2C6WP22_9STAP|nr:YdcF family protein [Staphylococcus edaphicus]PHK50129.1 hypothetical protein BTJ66_05115 [Staphylococcus edaphicus]
MNYIWSVIILIFIVTTVLAITLDKSNLYKGGCVNLSLFIAMFMLYIFAIDLNNYWLTLFLLLIAAFFVAILPLSLVLLIGSLCYLGWQLMTKEGKRLTNFLSLGLASVLISLLILSIIINSIKDTFFSLTWHWISALILYFMLHIFSFATTYLYLKFKRKNAPPAYIIILGSGLINNEVPPLLQSRIKKGLNLSKKFPNATIIFSGGQGEDEELAEGLAMQIYAQNQGLDVSNSIVENKSLNTYENLKFSKSYITNLNDLCYIITNHSIRYVLHS